MPTKYPALEAIMKYAMHKGGTGADLVRSLAMAWKDDDAKLALYQLIKFAGTNGFVPEGLERDVNRVVDKRDYMTLRFMALWALRIWA